MKVKEVPEGCGLWADWLPRPVTGFQGGVAWFAPMTNIYTVTFRRRTEGGGVTTISTAKVFWHDSASAPTPPAVDGFDPYGAWKQTKGVGGVGALREVSQDLTYELAYMRRRTVTFVVRSADSSGRQVLTTVYTAKVRYGSTVDDVEMRTSEQGLYKLAFKIPLFTSVFAKY